MTLILTLGNSEQVIQISDRRLSWQGALRDDESNKAGLLLCSNARLAFGFTGIAQCGSFCTQEWLLDTLSGVRASHSDALGAVTRLRDSATDTFSQHPALRDLPEQHRRLSIMFSGYLTQLVPPRVGCAVVTNDEAYAPREGERDGRDGFRLIAGSLRHSHDHEATFLQRVGSFHAMTREDEDLLRSLLAERKPARAIIGKAVDLVRQMAERPAAQNTIGKQLTVIRIPRDPRRSVQSTYSTAVNSFKSFMPDLVRLGPGEGSLAMRGLVVSMRTPGGSPAQVAFPKVGRNAPCPCGSGEKYKRCHGRAPSIPF